MPALTHIPHIWVRFLLAYLVFAGFVPLLSELRTVGARGNNPYHNFELAWGLMHIGAALAGIAIALWYLRYSSVFSTAVVVLLTLQILFPLLEYRREGFEPRMGTDLNWSGYMLTMLIVALPFIAAWYVVMRRHRPST